ncbi:thiamine pyrophosphate-binding protein [Ramlibacter sp. AN1015]|uniref:thiamine pyrophosphate-binding protein n=1 Tax=Ramlibacter sp. AN1015 TaxID=3133428 RepID=UPI0030C4FF81
MRGADLVVRALARRGVRTIFSLSGNQIMPLYDACIDARIRIVHVRHEAAAVFMADAWSQVTGEVGVAMLTAGPGLSNGVAPLFSALQSESPVLLLSGDSPLSEDGMGSFQEMDQAAITRPLTKLSRRVGSAAELAPSIDEAVTLALAGRPGPVHLALPFDLLNDESGFDALPPAAEKAAAAQPPSEVVQQIASLLAAAQRPVLLLGPSQARQRHRARWEALASALQVPVVPMESPRGLRDPSLGCVSDRIAEADLIVLAGKRLDFTVGFGRKAAFGETARVVAIDPQADMLERAGRLLGERLVARCQGDVQPTVDAIARSAKPGGDRTAWMNAVARAIAVRSLKDAPAAPQGAIGSQALCEAVQRVLDTAPNPILVCDGGEFGQWAQAFCKAPVRIVNGMSGAIGGGICYALAAKIAQPDATVVLLMGDGTAGFHFTEYDTAVRENAAFLGVIGNDLRWNAEHVIQMRSYGPDRLIGCSLSPTARYDEAAQALGGFGAAVQEPQALDGALRAALESGKPACLNVAIDGRPAPAFSQAAAVH